MAEHPCVDRAAIFADRSLQLLTPKELSCLWRVELWTVYRWIRERRIQGVHRIGREIRIDIVIATRPDIAA